MLHLTFKGWNLQRFVRIQYICLCTRKNNTWLSRFKFHNAYKQDGNNIVKDVYMEGKELYVKCIGQYS